MPVSTFDDATREGQPPSVVAVVGFSGAGKTSLVEQLIPRLRDRGLAVGAVKHTAHGFVADRPGKDSHRIYASGASAVALVSREQIATFRRRGVGEVRLGEALAQMPDGLDLVVAEGFAWEPVPRIWVRRPDDTASPTHLDAGPVLSVVEVEAPPGGGLPRFDDDRIDALVDRLADRVGSARANGSRVPIGAPPRRPPIASTLIEEVL